MPPETGIEYNPWNIYNNMKRNIIFAVLVAAAVALGQLGVRGTTYMLLHLVGVLYIYALMISSSREAASKVLTGNKITEMSSIQRPAA